MRQAASVEVSAMRWSKKKIPEKGEGAGRRFQRPLNVQYKIALSSMASGHGRKKSEILIG
jgi:hypothetical protein